MTLSYILRVVGEGGVAQRPSADYSWKKESADYSSMQNSGKTGCLSLQPSLLIQAGIDMGNPILY